MYRAASGCERRRERIYNLDLDSTRAEGRGGGCCIERVGWLGGKRRSKKWCGGAVRSPATSPRRYFQRGRCRCAARTPTGVPSPPPIGGRRTAEAKRHGCLLRGVAGTEHVSRRARLCGLLSCPLDHLPVLGSVVNW
jgi:hypothetical protein